MIASSHKTAFCVLHNSGFLYLPQSLHEITTMVVNHTFLLHVCALPIAAAYECWNFAQASPRALVLILRDFFENCRHLVANNLFINHQ